MNDVNVNKDITIEIVKNFVKDLSFENPQNVNENNSVNNNDNNIYIKMNVTFQSYNNNCFSLILRNTIDCSSKINKKKLFNLELDYFGFFKILGNNNYDQKLLTKKGLELLFPFVKEIVEYITLNGGSVPILLKEIDFELKKD
tara:strand:- start:66 stop:494 length:429 start_codon:yes stop_codon:yes gene_type:complete